MHVPKAFLILNDEYKDSLKLKKELKELCKEKLAIYSVPKEFEIRKDFPLLQNRKEVYFYCRWTKIISIADRWN